ncbi:M48 family metalloprotease [Pseudooceanicola sp. CBS1P-1]|uniref:M48 family metalloprotease n=1 Tax=Pseudooceanicola albus TaxID=2692189 RepID=A0A6L7GD05_9RHOB|nr:MULTISPECIES: M48 family metallopeptidase [Pseudooceanicola]MBT9384501.1 M48 family metalloprotease [Pseudooceanicola endophyticus]MXN21120.1 M48 family metalloprotease [Pseudooceanicola albus]
MGEFRKSVTSDCARIVQVARRLLPVLVLSGAVALSACSAPQVENAPDGESRLGPQAAAAQFAQVASTVEPVAEKVCRRKRKDGRCNFRILVDTSPWRPANAYQTLDRDNQPVLIFTLALIADMRNPDELAFVMSHEASHHILDHLRKQREYSEAGAKVYAEAAARGGASPEQQKKAGEIGAEFGARSYSKTFELQADYLGAQIALEAGYDPLKGAMYFQRLPDPGEEFLGSHPPNAERLATVKRAVRAAKRKRGS